MNKKIFISHSSSDNDIAEKVYQYFEKKGIGCWMDKHDIPPGASYAKAIMEGIVQCDAMVILISNNSINSEDVLNEIENAHKRKKALFPIFIDNVKISSELEYYISRVQWTTINGNNLANALDNLYTSINDKMGTTNAAKNNPALRIQSPSMPEVVSSTDAGIEAKKTEEPNHLKQALPSECVLKLKNKYSFRMKLSPTKKYYYIEVENIFYAIISLLGSKDNKKEMVEVLDRLPLNYIDSEDCKQIEKKYGIHFRKGSLAGIIQGSSRPCLILHLNNNKEFFQSLIKQNTK